MTKLFAGTMLVASIAIQSATAQSAEPKHAPATATVPAWKRIPVPPLHDFKPVQPHKIVLDNGLVLFLQEDHELPFIDGSILIRGGSQDEPAAKVGLVRMYGRVWRTSGTASTSGDALDDVLASKAASIETSGSAAITSMHWSSLKTDFDSVFATAMDLLQHPAFKQDKLALAKRQAGAGIARRNDDAGGIAGREAVQMVYGADSPYARQIEYATLDAIKLEDLRAWHDRTVVASNMIVSVEGDFDSSAMEAKLRATFGALPKGVAMPKAEIPIPPARPGVYFVNKPDVDQSTVYLVGVGTTRSNPDYYALDVMNEVFSGGFGSRLFQSVRTRLGLAYSVGGSFGAGYDHPGIFFTGAPTKSQSTVAATQAMLAEIDNLKTKPPTATELKSAKDQVLNAFIFNYDSPGKTLSEQVTLAFYGYPPDTLEKYKVEVEKVTSADVERVANKYIDSSRLAIVVVGNEAEFGTPLSKLGNVTNVDITIPPPPAPSKKP
jgi:zinc protease